LSFELEGKIGYGYTELYVGANNNTLRFWPTYELDFTAIIGPNCTKCTGDDSTHYEAQASMDQGFLTFLTNDTEVYRLHTRNPTANLIFIHGKWALETLSLKNETLLNMTYGNSTESRHRVFIIEKAETEV
jgi:hypothetical protein